MRRNLRVEIETALEGGIPRVTPLTLYDLLVPPNFEIDHLCAQGLAIAARRDIYRIEYRDVTVRQIHEKGGIRRTIYQTPIGSLSEVQQMGLYNAYCPLEHPIKQESDYRIAEFIVNHTHYLPRFSQFLEEKRKIADAGIVIAHTCYSPLLDIQIRWIGQERFCYELTDHEDALMSLYACLRTKQREMYSLVASSPTRYCLYGGNIVPEMVGPDRVRKYVLPCWQEFAEVLANENKKLGVHLDAENRLISDIIAESDLYFVEALTPPPDCSISVAEAREIWPDKKIWINFPSSIHICPDDRIRTTTRELLEQAGKRDGFLIGVTEDIPVQHMNRSLSIILQTIKEYCR